MANTYNSFEQYISENAALRQTLADTLTEKGVEASGKEGYATLVEKVGAIEAGTKLPTLSNPASPAEILSGYEAIGADGEVVTGTALETASTATAADIMSGKTAYNSAGVLLTGTASAGLKVTTATHSNTSSSTKFTKTVSGNIRYIGATFTYSSKFYTYITLPFFAIKSGLYLRYFVDDVGHLNNAGSVTWSGKTLTISNMAGESSSPAAYTIYIFHD